MTTAFKRIDWSSLDAAGKTAALARPAQRTAGAGVEFCQIRLPGLGIFRKGEFFKGAHGNGGGSLEAVGNVFADADGCQRACIAFFGEVEKSSQPAAAAFPGVLQIILGFKMRT